MLILPGIIILASIQSDGVSSQKLPGTKEETQNMQPGPLERHPPTKRNKTVLPRFKRAESTLPAKKPTDRGFKRGVQIAEEQQEARMSRQDVGERTFRARDGASGRSAGRRA